MQVSYDVADLSGTILLAAADDGRGITGARHMPRGTIQSVDEAAALCEPCGSLAFYGKHAFVGLSKPRYQRFEGLALDRKLAEADSEPWCEVRVIDLNSGTCAHWLSIDGPVAELYDAAVVPGVVRPMALGFASNEILGLITHDPLQEVGST